jgi:hypothetical protein
MLNKLWGINYFLVTGPTSDSENYLDLLHAQGYGAVAAADVIALHAASFLLSGGSLSLANGAFRFIFQGDSIVKPLVLRLGEARVFWPELTTWLNPDNVSLLVTFDAEWKDGLFMRAGVDTPILGNTSAPPELTLGARVRMEALSFGLEVTSRFAGLPFFSGNAELDLTDFLSAGIEGFYGAGNTMRELREYPLGPGAAGYVTLRL